MVSKVDQENREETKKKLTVFIAKNFLLVIILSAFLILALGFFIIIKPKYDRVNKEYEEVEELKVNYRIFYDNFNDTKDLLSIYNDLSSEDIEKVNKIIPSKDLPENLITELNSLINRNGLLMTSINIISDEDEDSVKKTSKKSKNEAVNTLPAQIGTIKVSTNILGVDYNSFKNLVVVLENNLRIFDVESIGFSPEAGACSLEFYTYYLKD